MRQAADVQQMLAEASGPGLTAQTAAALSGLAADAMRHVGWPGGVRFAAFDGSASLGAVLADSWAHTGAFLLIVPGSGPPTRWAMCRKDGGCVRMHQGWELRAHPNPALLTSPPPRRRVDGTPFLSLDPASANLTAALAPAAAAMSAAAAAVEAALGRRLFAFRLEEAPLPACVAGAGPCVLWEASSGRVMLHSGVAAAMAAAAGVPAAVGLPTAEEQGGSGLAALLAAFSSKLFSESINATTLLQGGQVRAAGRVLARRACTGPLV